MVCLRVPDWALLLPDSHQWSRLGKGRMKQNAIWGWMEPSSVILMTSCIIQSLWTCTEACRHTSTQVVHASVCTDWFLGLGLLDERTNIKEATGNNVAERVKKTKQNINMQHATTKKEPLLISCINIFKSENHLHKMMTLLLFYCLTSPQCLMWVLGFMGDVKIQFSGNLSAEETKPLSSIEH